MSEALKGKLAIKGERGYSSYEIAVQNGYPGTLEQFIADYGISDEYSREIISARGNYTNLKNRLDNSDSVKADKTITSDLQSQINIEKARIDNLSHLEEGSTTGDAELIDGRVSYNEKTYSSIGNAIRAQISEQIHEIEYISNNVISTENTTVEINKEVTTNKKICIKITNSTAQNGYFSIRAYQDNEENNQAYNINSVLISSNSYKLLEILRPMFIDHIKIVNTNTLSNIQVDIYFNKNNYYEKLAVQTIKSNKKVNGHNFIREEHNYIGNDGKIEYGESVPYDVFSTEVSNGDTFIIDSEEKGWAPLWGYDINGNATKLLNNKLYNNYIYKITNENIRYIRMLVKRENTIDSIRSYVLEDSINNIGKNNECYNMKGFALLYNTRTTIINKTETSLSFEKTESGNSNNLQYETNRQITSENSYILARFKIRSDILCQFNIGAFTSGSDVYYQKFILEPEKEYEIYFKTPKKLTINGTLKFQFGTTNRFSGTSTIEITDFYYTINNSNVYHDLESFKTLKDFETKSIIVDRNGKGHFYLISEACDYLKNCEDVNNKDFIIYVKNGTYTEYPTNDYPYASISKGSNKISIIGETKEKVIINCYNTSTHQSKVLDIGGPCVIENLTINCLNDGTYNISNDLHHNCYSIHNDTTFETTEKYTTIVKNCKLYSECHSPVGAGLQNKQIQRYENVETISNGIKSNGSLYVHASADSSANNMEVEIIDCTCISKDKTKALTLPNVDGSLPYTEIPVTIQKSIFATNGNEITDQNFKANHNLTSLCALNNIDDFNY